MYARTFIYIFMKNLGAIDPLFWKKNFFSCSTLLYFQDLKYTQMQQGFPLQEAPRLAAYLQEAEEVKKATNILFFL